MTDTFTTIALIVLTLVSLAAAVVAVVRQRRRDTGDGAGRTLRRWQVSLMGVCIVGAAGLFVYRAAHGGWRPLEAHVDGLLLIGALLAAAVMFLQSRAHIRGLSLFAPPLLTLIFAWAICASLWTFRPFEIDSVWKATHLTSVYGGMLFFAVASIAGVMYLYVQRKLKRTHDPTTTRSLASLESIETLIIRTSAVGFALLTLGLVTGLVIVTSDPTQRLGAGWWYSPKIVLAFAVWLIYALVMNVRHTTSFRGARAAWLSIAGLVLLLATFGIALMLDKEAKSSLSVPAPDAPVREVV